MGFLTDIGYLKDGALSDSARVAFLDNVAMILDAGNVGDPAFFLLHVAKGTPLSDEGVLIPLAPLGSMFWPGIWDLESHAEQFPTFHQIILDTMMQGVAVGLDIPGNTPFAPIMDPTLPLPALDLELPPLGLPDFALMIPTFPISLFEMFDIPAVDWPALILKLPLPKIPPDIPLPPLPPLPIDIALSLDIPLPPAIPLPFPYLDFIMIPFDLFLVLVLDLPGLLAALPNPMWIIEWIIEKIIEIILKIIPPLLAAVAFLASIVVWVKNIVVILALCIVASILGAGLIVTILAKFFGLL